MFDQRRNTTSKMFLSLDNQPLADDAVSVAQSTRSKGSVAFGLKNIVRNTQLRVSSQMGFSQSVI